MAKSDVASYRVSVRGPVPPDLVRRVSSAHAEAIVRASRNVMVAAERKVKT